jgi:hypothetical protein
MSAIRRAVLTVGLAAGVLAPPVLAATPQATPPPPVGFWVAGDLHVHSIYGHDTCITPTTAWDETSPDRGARVACEDPYTVGYSPRHRYAEADRRGLDFLAITDHNNVVNQKAPAALAWLREHPGFVAIPAYENSQPGHVQMLGARGCISNTGLVPGAVVKCNQYVTDQSAAGEQQLAQSLRAAGGAFQINHPSDFNWNERFGHTVVPDTVEVWNIGVWAWQHPFPSSNDNNYSLDWYDGFLRAGHQVAVTGGSDSHWVATDSAQGVGEPTTWVFVRELTVAGVLEGLRAHHTFVSTLPPAAHGPQLFLEADRDGDGVFEAIAGSETTLGSAYRVRTTNALPGSVLRIVTDTGQVQVRLPVNGVYSFRPGKAGVPRAALFVRAEMLLPDARSTRQQRCDPVLQQAGGTYCSNDLVMQALTSPVFVR